MKRTCSLYTNNHTTPVKISDLYQMTLEGSTGYARLRDTLSSLSTDRLVALWKVLATELPRLRGNDWFVFKRIFDVVAEIHETRASGEASSRLLGGAA